MHLTDFFVDGPLRSHDFTLFLRFTSLKARLIYLFVQRAKALKKLTKSAGNIMICFSAAAKKIK